jgi:hypothetical protein
LGGKIFFKHLSDFKIEFSNFRRTLQRLMIMSGRINYRTDKSQKNAENYSEEAPFMLKEKKHFIPAEKLAGLGAGWGWVGGKVSWNPIAEQSLHTFPYFRQVF